MLKVLFFSLALLLCFDANAIIKQSVSKALSYKNVINSRSRRSNNSERSHRGAITKNKTENPVILPQKNEKINLTSSNTATVKLNKNDEVEVTLNNEDGYRWKISPSAPSIQLVSQTTNGNNTVLKYSIEASLHSYIYFDQVNIETNKVEKTKQLNIQPRD